jgi:hypothetical protein
MADPDVLSTAPKRAISTRHHRDGSVTITVPGEKPFRVWPTTQRRT